MKKQARGVIAPSEVNKRGNGDSVVQQIFRDVYRLLGSIDFDADGTSKGGEDTATGERRC